jgi:DNA-binding XRE family transcriptional regulator
MRGESADAALADAAHAADDAFRIPAAVVNALLEGEQPVRVWREQRGLTQAALAAKVGISKAHLCQIEMRKRVGALKTLRAIADALAVSVPDLTYA